jgi:hypothetical protein
VCRHSDLFVYKNRESFEGAGGGLQPNGFVLYDPVQEFKRQQIPAKQWRLTKLNRDFRYPRFPNLFTVPEALTDGK